MLVGSVVQCGEQVTFLMVGGNKIFISLIQCPCYCLCNLFFFFFDVKRSYPNKYASLPLFLRGVTSTSFTFFFFFSFLLLFFFFLDRGDTVLHYKAMYLFHYDPHTFRHCLNIMLTDFMISLCCCRRVKSTCFIFPSFSSDYSVFCWLLPCTVALSHWLKKT